MPHDVRSIRGKSKGQFIKKRVKERIETFIGNVDGKRGQRRRMNDPGSEIVVPEKRAKITMMEGCRVFNVPKLAEDLWCNNCDACLSLRHVVHEQQSGIASKITVQCQHCKKILQVLTSEKKSKYYDTNLKLAIGMLDAGIGETKINTVMSAVNIPTVSTSSMKRYERHVGQAIETLAKASCEEAIKMEKMLTIQDLMNKSGGGDVNNNEESPTELKSSIDTAWTKRTKSNNSLSGHSTLIGYFSGKVISYACRNIYCKQCKMNTDKKHTCKRNHQGSSKAMESEMAVEMVLKNDLLVKSNCVIKIIIGDDDAAYIAALRRLSPYSIQKWSDFNHVKKTFNSKLWDMKLTANLREYFAKMFAIAVQSNKDDEFKVKIALQSIVPHAFGNHDLCGSFCTTDENGVHVYKHFKNGLCLTDMGLKEKLERIIQPFINNVAQIAPCASSQRNESFNHTAVSKHSKADFYGGSESHTFRIASAVCQKNLGYEYIILLNKILGISPGKHSQIFRRRKQGGFKRRQEEKNTVAKKKRRLILKKERSCRDISTVKREGISYQSGSGYLNTSNLIDEVMLPGNVALSECFIVVYDTETTGFHATDPIVQLAGVCGGKSFSAYITPTKEMSPQASEVTGITTWNGEMFDAPRVIKLAEDVGLLKELEIFVKGFCDSKAVFHSLLPDRAKSKPKKSFKQPDLVSEYLDPCDVLEAHDALNDVIMLEKLLRKLCGEGDTTPILNHTVSFEDTVNWKKKLAIAKQCKSSLAEIDISEHMKKKISNAGINMEILQEAYKGGGYEGLQILLGENIGGKPRVTTTKKIINKVFEYFSK
ncbi:hypothetical protein QAD02_012746 [Eretmocerus hayati]|uniref:Uncharacterized protein n=1 Tax=Eretmocerus hayati TaxID=131215 RepID=A0ACC2P0A2_9HYME|nr:hypothetical protein QAD02_012746 [Eretmocerus hayati]